MSEQALGKWPNAPLAMVLAQIRFQQEVGVDLLDLGKKLKKAMGDKLPSMQNIKRAAFLFNGASKDVVQTEEERVTGYDLRSDDNRRSLLLEDGAITYSTSIYVDSSHFLAEWRSILDVLCQEGNVKVLRIGLRYVDFIIPSADKQPEDYFQGGFGCSPAILSKAAQASFVRYEYPSEDGRQINIQYGRGIGKPGLPPDLNGSVALPDRLLAKYQEGESAVLDIDHWRQQSERKGPEEITRDFQALRNGIADIFHRIISPEAVHEWSQPI